MTSKAAPPDQETAIPDKLYFRIGEVAQLVGVEQYVLRYWEKEFPGLAPKKSGRNHRLYSRKNVELALEIKQLLYEQRFTIEGALKHLQSKRKRGAKKPEALAVQSALFSEPAPTEVVAMVRGELEEILKILR